MRCITIDKHYTASIYTLGCKVNFYESEAIAESLSSMGVSIKDFDDVCDIYIINTCSVTNTSDSKSRKIIREASRKNKDAIIKLHRAKSGGVCLFLRDEK